MRLVLPLKRSFRQVSEYRDGSVEIAGEIDDTAGAESRLFIIRGISYARRRFVTIIVIFIAILIADGRQGGGVR